jgi:hypothetical protein
MHWLAGRQGDASLLWHELHLLDGLAADPTIARAAAVDRLLPMLLIWGRPHAAALPVPAETAYFGNGQIPVAMFRSGWDARATFVALKGGRANSNHGHMDAGTFVLDALGQRWAEDLDKQDYHSIESKGLNLWSSAPTSDRWRIFRLGASAHNVLMVDGQDHHVDGDARFRAHSDRSATLDLSPVFAGQLQSAQREVLLHPDGRVTLTDQVCAPDRPVTIRWAMLTRAQIEITLQGAVLRRNGQTLRLQVQGLPDVKLQTYRTDPPPASYDSPNPGTGILGFETRLKANETQRWHVEFVPQP